MIRRKSFPTHELRKVADAPPPDSPPLGIGDKCQLISGSPVLLIVDVDRDQLTVSWPNINAKVVEAKIGRAALRRTNLPTSA